MGGGRGQAMGTVALRNSPDDKGLQRAEGGRERGNGGGGGQGGGPGPHSLPKKRRGLFPKTGIICVDWARRNEKTKNAVARKGLGLAGPGRPFLT